MAKTIQKSPAASGQLEPLLKAAALRRLQQETTRGTSSPKTAAKAPAKASAKAPAKALAKKRKKA